jgi:hypothetical protein
MKPVIILTLLAIFTLPLVAEAPKGTVPRASAAKYASHAEAGGASMGAVLLTSKDIHKAFTTDLARCCRVVEVALYPAKGKAVDVSPDDFVLRLAGTDTAVKASSAVVVAAQLQQANRNETAGNGVNMVVGGHVGYESGIDPITGQRVHGIETGGGVGVSNAQPEPRPAITDRDRYVMELELNEKALPDDTVTAPVAGYLYFSLAKDNKKASHELEYILNGQKVTLKLD